jgi:branched-chain amino acid transport system ATP-binding protein
MNMSLLDIRGIDVFYGDVQVVYDLSLTVNEGEVVSIIGGNGAGKSTLLRTISGLLQALRRRDLFSGQPMHTRLPEDIVEAGLIHVPEGRRLFSLMSVADNLSWAPTTSGPTKARGREPDQGLRMLPRLLERAAQLAMTLSGGEQQMVAIGRGLMAMPKLLMLDEPSLGLAPLLIQEIFRTVRMIADQGTTVLLVEQDVATP